MGLISYPFFFGGGGLIIGDVPLDGSHFHDWIDSNGVAFPIVTRMGSHIFGSLG